MIAKRYLSFCLLGWLTATAQGADRTFDFSEMPTNRPPLDCYSLVGGQGKPGTWKVLRDELPLPIAPLSPQAPSTAPQAVVGQVAWESTDEHFPMLQLGTNTYGDFTLRTKFKIVDGLTEQMAGIAFRMQDEKNYYYVRASALGNTFYFFSVVKGVRSAPIGNNVTVQKGVWHELMVQCDGPKIVVALDGQTLPDLNDKTFSAGRVAYWTKSDSISYFTDTHIHFTPRESFAQVLVADFAKQYPRLVGLNIYMVPPRATALQLVASKDPQAIGAPAEKWDADVIAKGVNFYRKQKELVYVTMPLRDRNGDPVAAVEFVMKSFTGQTEDNAMVRAMPMLKEMQTRASAVESLY